MSLEWAVVILDRVSQPGFEREQDLAAIGGVDMQKTVFHPTTSPHASPSHLELSFPIATPDLNIREMMHVWAGWRDTDTGFWSDEDPYGDPAPPFGGYITELQETTYGGEKRFECTLSDYGILFNRTLVLGWPNLVTDQTVPRLGYPGGYSVFDWLAGTKQDGRPYDGIVRSVLGNGSGISGNLVLFDGIDPVFDEIVFNPGDLPGLVDIVPGQPQVDGRFTFITLGKAVQAIADKTYIVFAEHYTGGDLTIGFWMSAVAYGQRIVPRFNFSNVADLTAGAEFVVRAGDPVDPTDVRMQHPHWHHRDATEVATRVIWQGVGFDGTLPPPYRQVYADVSNPDHLAVYPTDFQLIPGWTSEPILESRSHTIALARFLANIVESRIWGARGRIEFVIDKAVFPGQRIHLIDENEGEDGIFVVTSVEQISGQAGYPLYKVSIGFSELTLQDILKGGLPDVLLNVEDFAWQNDTLTSRAYPGTGQQIPLEMAPRTVYRNWVTPGYKDSPGLTLQATSQARLLPSGLPDPATATAALFQAKPPVTVAVPNPDSGTWVSPLDARPHPQVYSLLFTTSETQGPFLLHWDADFASIKIKGTGSVTLKRNGTSVAGPFSGAGKHAFTAVHFDDLLNDDWSVTATGVSGNLSVTVAE